MTGMMYNGRTMVRTMVRTMGMGSYDIVLHFALCCMNFVRPHCPLYDPLYEPLYEPGCGNLQSALSHMVSSTVLRLNTNHWLSLVLVL